MANPESNELAQLAATHTMLVHPGIAEFLDTIGRGKMPLLPDIASERRYFADTALRYMHTTDARRQRAADFVRRFLEAEEKRWMQELYDDELFSRSEIRM